MLSKMIDVMHSIGRPMNQAQKSLDPQLWHACAGGMAQIPPPNSKVYYFPQGHAEHAYINPNLNKLPKISPLVHCKVSSIKYLADRETDEVYVKIRLVPLKENEFEVEKNEALGFEKYDDKQKTDSFAKTLTQSDANNGGGFSVPRYCAETIFPRLDYSAEPPVQTILAKDVHGQIWKFRHIYRGTPRRHLLTTGWSNFVNQKKLVAGDSVVFVRSESGELCIGIRRAKRGIFGGPEVLTGWNTGPAHLGPSRVFGLPGDLSDGGKGNADNGECVIEAVSLAAGGHEFEVFYYPRASTPEFVVRSRAVKAAMGVRWCPGMRFKMAFETEDSSRISWFMGTVKSVQVEDSVRWPNSPWRLLQVAWDEPDLLQNVKRVSPWLVELVSNLPPSFLPPLSPPKKRTRLTQPNEFPLNIPTLFTNPLSPSSPLCCSDNMFAGVQGARHARSGPNTDLNLHMTLQPFDFKLLSYVGPPENKKFAKNNDDIIRKTPGGFVLFGQPILTEEQISRSYSVNSLSDGNQENMTNGSNESCSRLANIHHFLEEPSSDGGAVEQCTV
ncbi:auxin response factor [Striga asiatica]|uniref:Auxin response factor n=1 Tax=Striga asiatica TaxID=4170 RepID=A0A5A7R4P8_STRAF|nr:auxin response factor [Striga asiatica]